MIGLKWIARVGSLLSVGLILLFVFGESNSFSITPKEWIGLLFFPVGVVMGMLVAWWKEGTGAFIALISLIAFYGIYGLLLGSHITGWAFVVFTAPAFLFLLYWIFSKGKLAKAH